MNTMNSFVNLVEKFQFEILNNKGHRHLYDRFEELLQRLIAGEGQSEEEQRLVEETVNILLTEGISFIGCWNYNYYVVRCYICAYKLFDFIQNADRKAWLQHNFGKLIANIRKNLLLPYFPNDFFVEYNNRLLIRKEFDSVLESIRQSFYVSDAGRRPHVYHDERGMYEQFKRGYELAKKYLNQTHDYERYADWFKILNPIHVGDVLASIPEDQECDKIGDLVDETLTMQIEMLEDWKRKSYESFVTNGGEQLLSRCLEF